MTGLSAIEQGIAMIEAGLQQVKEGFIGLPGGGAFTCDAATFDGTNDWLSRGGNLTGITNSPTGTLSVFLLPPAEGGFNGTVIANDVITGLGIPSFTLADVGEGHWGVVLQAADGGSSFAFVALNALPSGWFHVAASWNVNAAASSRTAHQYVQDVSDLTNLLDNGDAFSVEYESATEVTIGDGSVTGKYTGDMAELWFDTTYIDLSVEANRRKFISAAGKPVDLGTDGSTPTGSQPLIYLHLDDGEAAANFALNAGSGGDFTVNGALATAATSPSD